MVQTGDVARAQDIIKTNTALYNEKGVAQSKLWPKGTLCITIAANIGDTGILGFEACFPDSVVGFVPAEPMDTTRFFQNVMRTRKQYLEDKAPATAQKNINLAILEVIPVALPPLAEQKRIVAKVDELMAWCDELEALKEKRAALRQAALKSSLRDLCDLCGEDSLARINNSFSDLVRDPADVKQLRDAILQLAVQGRLVEQRDSDGTAADLLKEIEAAKTADLERRKANGERIRKTKPLPPIDGAEIPFEIPHGWEWVNFTEIAEFQAGRTPGRKNATYWADGTIPWVSISDMKEGASLSSTKESVTELAKKEAFKCEPVPAGSMLMSFKLTIGKISRLNVPAFHNEAIISMTFAVPDLDPYLFIFLGRFARMGVTKAAIKGATLNRVSISNIKIPLPPLAEQQRIVEKVDELMAWCDELEALLKAQSDTAARFAAAIAQTGSCA